ncbi:MAG TPA: hypothetical protein VGC11_06180 [Acidimicrobiia bacterium]|jgi:hypothetical protein
MTTIRVVPAVLYRSARLVPWWHLVLGLVAAVALAATRRTDYVDDVVFGLRVGAVALAVSLAFVLDDPALSVTDGKPVPLWLPRLARLALVLPVPAAGWWLLMDWMEAEMQSTPETAATTVPRVALTIELAAFVGIVLGFAALVVRSGREAGGLVAAVALLGAVVALLMLPERWRVFASPASPPLPGEAPSPIWEVWVDAHRRWAAIAAAGWVALAVGVRGPARGRLARWAAATSGRIRRAAP